jgi:GT2 family glycosyltransferase
MLKSSMRSGASGRSEGSVNLPAPGFNQYNVTVLQASSSIQHDFARILTQKFGRGRLLVVGVEPDALEKQCADFGLMVTICRTASECEDRAPARNGEEAPFGQAVWFYPATETNEERDRETTLLAQQTDDILLIPGPGAEVLKTRPELVERFVHHGFVPDYDCDVGELGAGAVRLLRRQSESAEGLVPAVESAFARLHLQVRNLQRTLRTRMSELEAADRHIAKLEEKVLKLREAKREVKQLKQEKHALRKSPERKVGQVLLAPYRLPQKLFREVRKQWLPPNESKKRIDSASEYQAWLQRHRISPDQAATMREEAQQFTAQPLISIITPVFNTPVAWLEEAIDSVVAQIYENWELLLVDDASTDAETIAALPQFIARDSRIRFARREESGGISAASNDAIKIARGDWIGLLDHDDFLEPDALFQVVKVLQTHPDADLIYSDEDKLTENGFEAPSLKPDWSPDFFLSYNYVCHFTCLRRKLAEEVAGFRPEFDGAQDYDLFLRVTERTNRIHHVPRVLYHWRRGPTSVADNIRRKPLALEAGKRAIEEHLQRRGDPGHVAIDWRTHAYWVKREIQTAKKISIIIPARDRIELLSRCVESLITKTRYHNYEIVIVNNDSVSEEARAYFSRMPHRLLHFSGPFNFSALNNFAVEQTESPWLLFLNNDVEVIDGEWLSTMAEHVQRPEVGAVGARLLYPNNTIQHAGVVIGVGGIAEHAFRGFPAEHAGVCRQLQVTRNYSCVTGACLLTRRDVFTEVGGFDEERLPVTFNDVDLCLKMRRAGYLVVYTPFAKLYHHESASRRRTIEALETDVIRERWPELLERDPYYNPNLTRERADFSLGE